MKLPSPGNVIDPLTTWPLDPPSRVHDDCFHTYGKIHKDQKTDSNTDQSVANFRDSAQIA